MSFFFNNFLDMTNVKTNQELEYNVVGLLETT